MVVVQVVEADTEQQMATLRKAPVLIPEPAAAVAVVPVVVTSGLAVPEVPEVPDL